MWQLVWWNRWTSGSINCGGLACEDPWLSLVCSYDRHCTISSVTLEKCFCSTFAAFTASPYDLIFCVVFSTGFLCDVFFFNCSFSYFSFQVSGGFCSSTGWAKWQFVPPSPWQQATLFWSLQIVFFVWGRLYLFYLTSLPPGIRLVLPIVFLWEVLRVCFFIIFLFLSFGVITLLYVCFLGGSGISFFIVFTFSENYI